jgi:hypothetical protein
MIVLFKNIPDNSYHNDISNLVEPVIKGSLLSKGGHINSIEIIALQEVNTQDLEFQALASIEPDVVAQRVIKKLHGLNLRGHRVVVREYFIRNWKNDKRSEGSLQMTSQFKDRRTTTCRRRKLKMFKIALPEYA